MENIKHKTSIITLRTYVDVLTLTAKGELKNIEDLKEHRDLQRVALELLDSGLISDFSNSHTKRNLVITPEGASSLEHWNQYLKETSFLYKLGENLLRFLWVIVGALAASITQFIELLK